MPSSAMGIVVKSETGETIGPYDLILSGALGGTPNGVCQGSYCLGNADNEVITTLLEIVGIFVLFFYFTGNVSTDSTISKELTLD